MSIPPRTGRVLFVGKRFYTNRDALAERYGRIYQLPLHWAAAGISCHLWLLDYHTRETVRRRDAALSVVSTPVRGLGWLREWRESVRNPGPDGYRCVVASGDCYLGLVAYRVARRLGARFVFDVYDKYDEFPGYRRLPGFDPFGFLLRHADARFFASRALMARAGGDAARDLLVPNGIDTQHFRPLDRDAGRTALGLPPDVPLVGYFGSMDPDRGVDDLVAAIERLRSEGLPVELVLAGKRRADLDLGRPGIRYLGNLPYAQVPQALASCDVLALPYRHSALLDMASSCKIAEYMAAARPIAATRTPNLSANFPDQARILDDLLAAPGDVASLARSIRAQLAERRLATASPRMAWDAIAADAAARLGLAGAT